MNADGALTSCSKKILVVDDDAAIREAMVRVLRDSGYSVSSAADGSRAEWLLKCDVFDLLILDLCMPYRDGWDVLGFTTAERRSLPVIVLTGFVRQLETTMIPGANLLMTKPVDVGVFLNEVEKLLVSNETRYADSTVGSRGQARVQR